MIIAAYFTLVNEKTLLQFSDVLISTYSLQKLLPQEVAKQGALKYVFPTHFASENIMNTIRHILCYLCKWILILYKTINLKSKKIAQNKINSHNRLASP